MDWQDLLAALSETRRINEESYARQIGDFEDMYKSAGTHGGSNYLRDKKLQTDIIGRLRNAMGDNFKYLEYMIEKDKEQKAQMAENEALMTGGKNFLNQAQAMLSGFQKQGYQPQYGGQGVSSYLGQAPMAYQNAPFNSEAQALRQQEAKLPTYEDYWAKILADKKKKELAQAKAQGNTVANWRKSLGQYGGVTKDLWTRMNNGQGLG